MEEWREWGRWRRGRWENDSMHGWRCEEGEIESYWQRVHMERAVPRWGSGAWLWMCVSGSVVVHLRRTESECDCVYKYWNILWQYGHYDHFLMLYYFRFIQLFVCFRLWLDSFTFPCCTLYGEVASVKFYMHSLPQCPLWEVVYNWWTLTKQYVQYHHALHLPWETEKLE